MGTVSFERHTAKMQSGVEDHPPGKSRIDATCDGYLQFALENSELFKLVFSSSFHLAEDPALKQAGWASYTVFRDAAHGLDWDETDAPGGPWRTDWMLWGPGHGYTMLLIDGEIRWEADGAPLFSSDEIMFGFGYRPDVSEMSPEPCQGQRRSDDCALWLTTPCGRSFAMDCNLSESGEV